MNVSDILRQVKENSGSNAKKEILKEHSNNALLKRALLYGSDPFTPFHVVKIPKTKARRPALREETRWTSFFDVADLCARRSYTGNMAIDMMSDVFSVATEEEEAWMRKILRKHLAIGASVKTINKVFPGLIPTFDVSLAQKFDFKRLGERSQIAVEPKLDGIRCFAIVQDKEAKLFARSGKLITNFDKTIGRDLARLGNGCYDGELMGEDFTSLMRQAYRKENVDTDSTWLSLFDFLPLEEWKSGEPKMSCHKRRNELSFRIKRCTSEKIKLIPRYIVDANESDINDMHNVFVEQGYEGAMVKFLDAPYKFGRGYEVMKLKSFHDVDLIIEALEEGTGKHSGKLGAIVVDFNAVKVRVGSGFSDDLREKMWNDQGNFVGRIAEVRYQEVTPDGSLRFPTFVCFRNDR